MGKVFTAEQIRDGHIPEPGAHLAAARYLADQLFYDQKAFAASSPEYVAGIQSGLIHGSAVHGSANTRSDVDIVLIHNPDPTTLNVVHDVFSQVEKTYNVPIEANVISVEDATSNNHTIDPLFLGYLKTADENPEFSWQWPTHVLGSGPEYTQLDLARVVRRYVGAKSSSFGKGLVSDEKFDMHILQRALELPKNLGRKVLSMHDPTFSAIDRSAEDILKGVLNFVDDRGFAEDLGYGSRAAAGLRYLLGMDNEYSELLTSAIKGQTTLEDYEQWINLRKRDIVVEAMLACEPIAISLQTFMAELTSQAVYLETSKPEAV